MLKLNSDSFLQFVHLAKRVKTKHCDHATVGFAYPFDALHRSGFSCSVRPDQSKDLSLADLERRLLDGHCFAIGLADSGDFNDWMHVFFENSRHTEPDAGSPGALGRQSVPASIRRIGRVLIYADQAGDSAIKRRSWIESAI